MNSRLNNDLPYISKFDTKDAKDDGINVEITQLYQDNWSSEVKDLEDLVGTNVKMKTRDYDAMIKKFQKKGKNHLNAITNNIMSVEGRDHKKIMKLWAEEFHAEEAKSRKARERSDKIMNNLNNY